MHANFRELLIKMKVFVGTSGWHYSWNPDLSLDWYITNSGLNSIELNSSFYRFPFPNQVKGWANKTKLYNPKIRWSVKVNRLITHVFRFNDNAFNKWKIFENLFKPLDKFIYFYLFQLPPSFKSNNFEKIEKFFKKTKLKERFALEFRNIEWFKDKWIDWAKKLKLTLVSVDAPEFTKFPRKIFNINGIVYLRMHGRKAWYSHNYTEKELEEVKYNIEKENPKEVYVFFNNNHNMLENARKFLKAMSYGNIRRDKDNRRI